MNLGDDDLLLCCVIEGESESFQIRVEGSSWHNPKVMVGDLKKKIQEERENDSLAGVGAHNLVLWKVRAIEDSRCQTIWLTSLSFQPKDTNPIDVNLADLASIRTDEQLAEKLPSTRPVGYIFPNQPPLDRLHIIVGKPDTGE